MKLIDAIKRVDRGPGNNYEASIRHFNGELGINVDDNQDLFGKRVREHYLIKWYCTDSWVGLRVYYMDDEPVAVSFQKGRKWPEEFEFVSKEAAIKLRDFMLSLDDNDEEEEQFSLIDPDEELPEQYHVSFVQQLLVEEGIYNGQIVKLNKRFEGCKDISNWEFVEVTLPNGEVSKVPLDQVSIPLHMTEAQNEQEAVRP